VTVWKYLEVVAICRALRWIWQNTEAALIQLAALHVFTSSGLVPAAAAESLTALLSPAQLMMILSFIHDRLVQLAEKLYLFVLLTTTSIDDRFSRKGRHRNFCQLLFILAYIKPIIEYLRQRVMPLFTKLFSLFCQAQECHVSFPPEHPALPCRLCISGCRFRGICAGSRSLLPPHLPSHFPATIAVLAKLFR
jgi:hypothetical protein